MKRKYKYNKKADLFLKTLYGLMNAKTWKAKYDAIMLLRGIDPDSQSFSHNPSWEQKVGMLEYELLWDEDLIKLILV